jgi:hypothetical protein
MKKSFIRQREMEPVRGADGIELEHRLSGYMRLETIAKS